MSDGNDDDDDHDDLDLYVSLYPCISNEWVAYHDNDLYDDNDMWSYLITLVRAYES